MMSQNPHIETYAHKYSKDILASWFYPEYDAYIEMPVYFDGIILFIPDVILSQNNRYCAFYEIVKKHGLTGHKIGRIQLWSYYNYDVPVYEVSSDYILNQIDRPPICGSEIIFADKFYTETHE